MDSARLVHFTNDLGLRNIMLEKNNFRNIPLTSNTLKMSSNATSSAERKGRNATGGLGSRN